MTNKLLVSRFLELLGLSVGLSCILVFGIVFFKMVILGYSSVLFSEPNSIIRISEFILMIVSFIFLGKLGFEIARGKK